jgi:hypothetical protein
MSRKLATLVLLVCSCSRSTPEPRVTSDPIDASAPTVEKPKPVVAPVWCDSDKECAFDDPCNAKACVGAPDAPWLGCDESAPRPGTCVCAAHQCTLIRKSPATGAVKTGCTKDSECAFLPATGSCGAGTAATWVEDRSGFCTCSAGTCTPEWVEPVACKTSADCSWLENPRRVAPAKKVPRPYPPITPCKTGEFDSACVAGRCVLQQWKC